MQELPLTNGGVGVSLHLKTSYVIFFLGYHCHVSEESESCTLMNEMEINSFGAIVVIMNEWVFHAPTSFVLQDVCVYKTSIYDTGRCTKPFMVMITT